MKKYPSIWKLRSLIHDSHLVSVLIGGEYVPARPHGWPSLRNRFRCAWVVFTGKADAVIWPEDER